MAVDVGINFRATAGFVADSAGQTYCIGDLYPTTRGGLTFGWSGTVSTRDRTTSSTFIPEFAGMNFVATLGAYFQIDLPAAGSTSVHAIFGDATGNNPTAWDLYDSSTLLTSITGTAPGTGNIRDATSVVFTSLANWRAGETPYTYTAASTTFKCQVRTGSQNNVVAHLRVVQAGGGTDTPLAAGPGAFAATGSPAVLGVGLNAGAGSFSISGPPALLGIALNAAPGSFVVTGYSADLTAGGNVAMDAAPGSFAATAAAAALGVGLNAGAGSYSGSGAAAAFGIGFGAGAGAVVLSGAAAALDVGLAAGPGDAGLSGSPVLFGVGLNGGAGAFVLTGYAASLVDSGQVVYVGPACGTITVQARVGGTITILSRVGGTVTLEEC